LLRSGGISSMSLRGSSCWWYPASPLLSLGMIAPFKMGGATVELASRSFASKKVCTLYSDERGSPLLVSFFRGFG